MSDFRLPDRISFARHELAAVTGLSAAFWDAQFAAGKIFIRTGGGHEIVLRSDIERVIASLSTKTYQSPEELEQARIADFKAEIERGRQIALKALDGDGTVDPRVQRGREIRAQVSGRRS